MRLFFLISVLGGIALVISLSAKQNGASPAPGISEQTSACSSVEQPVAQKSCGTAEFTFTGFCCSANRNTETCCNSTVNGVPIFTHGELKHLLCALEVRRNTEEIKYRESVFSTWVSETQEVSLCQ